jgi:formate dehydrogenase major subunit
MRILLDLLRLTRPNRYGASIGKAKLFLLEWIEPCETSDQQFDLHLNNGRLLENFHEANMTCRVPGIRQENPERWVEVSPELAQERGLHSGHWVEIKSRHGEVRPKVLVTERVEGKQVYLPLNSQEGPVNILTSSNTAYKETALQMSTLPYQGPSPLMASNFRHHPSPTTQRGVEVERKWKQPGYRMPGSNLLQIQAAKK